MSYAPKPKKVAYLVFVGRVPGLYETWDEARAQVEGYPGAKFMGYYGIERAWTDWRIFEENGDIPNANRHTKDNTAALQRVVDHRVMKVVVQRAAHLVANFKSGHVSSCSCGMYPACLHV